MRLSRVKPPFIDSQPDFRIVPCVSAPAFSVQVLHATIPEGSRVTLEMMDDGIGSDAVEGDGSFTLPLPPLLLPMFSGLYMFVLPHAGRWRNGAAS